jgi:hypothetical protein
LGSSGYQILLFVVVAVVLGVVDSWIGGGDPKPDLTAVVFQLHSLVPGKKNIGSN